MIFRPSSPSSLSLSSSYLIENKERIHLNCGRSDRLRTVFTPSSTVFIHLRRLHSSLSVLDRKPTPCRKRPSIDRTSLHSSASAAQASDFTTVPPALRRRSNPEANLNCIAEPDESRSIAAVQIAHRLHRHRQSQSTASLSPLHPTAAASIPRPLTRRCSRRDPG